MHTKYSIEKYAHMPWMAELMQSIMGFYYMYIPQRKSCDNWVLAQRVCHEYVQNLIWGYRVLVPLVRRKILGQNLPRSCHATLLGSDEESAVANPLPLCMKNQTFAII